MRKLKIGIRSQLLLLVTFASLFSLFILAVVCGVYFSNNLTDLRAERLEVISQLKTSQVTQSLNYLYYQVYWLTTRDAITDPLISSRAGNNSDSVFSEAQENLDQFLTSSESFAAARLYNLELATVAESVSNVSTVSIPAMDYLYPLQQNLTVPQEIIALNGSVNSLYLTGPVSNDSDADSVFFVGMTYPVFANSSILLNQPSIAGYLSVITNANNIRVAVNETSATNQKTSDYTVMAIEPVFENVDPNGDADSEASEGNTQELVGFQAVFPVPELKMFSNIVYGINESSAVKEALTNGFGIGSTTSKKNINGQKVAVGYGRMRADPKKDWVIIVEQKLSTFNAPVDKFTKIIIGVSFGVGAFVLLITFPMTVLFIRPITRLKDATEAITRSKREKEKELVSHNGSNDDPEYNSPPPPYYSTFIRRLNPVPTTKKEKQHSEPASTIRRRSRKDDKRNSVLSSGTGGSGSLYSTGIRLPSKIQDTKKFFKDELTELTEAFNIMREELEKQYVHLEDRVKSRTKELEASKVEAEAANEAKTVFIANISHELRTPLNGILGMTSIAMEEEDTSRIKDSLKLINRSGELLLHILTELLTYSKNTLNRSKLEKSSFQILEIVYQVQSIFSKLATDQRVFFKILLKPNSLRRLVLYGDSNRIIQVVMNLVSNSLKFTPVDGRVDVTFKLLGEYDGARSKENDYDAVYVTGHDSAANTRSNHVRRSVHQDHQGNDAGSFVSSLDDVHEVDEVVNDNESVVTLSTAQYQDVVFRSQFKADGKPLPTIPSDSENCDTQIESSSQGSSTGENSESENVRNGDPNFKSLPPSPATQRSTEADQIDNISHTSQPPELPSKNGQSQPQSQVPGKLLPPPNMRDNLASTGSTTTTKRPSLSSDNSSLSGNELVKNDKVFKIKNLYKSKSWVLQIEVTDTGPGIEPALQEKVFEPFIQGDQTLSRSYGGTGLGLSICRQLAKMMNGTMKLKSTLGVGSTFIFTVPLPQVGEILVPDSEMNEFCEDEFNPKSKMNRKVAFTFNNTDVTTSEDDMTDANGTSREPNSSSESNMAPTQPPTFQPISTSSPKDIISSGPQSDQEHSGTGSSSDGFKTPNPPSFNIQKPSQKSSDEDTGAVSDSNGSKRKIFFEKPHLVTRSSTGTANSSNGSDRLDVSNHMLLDDLCHLKILVAEDNLVNQEVIKRMLSLEGFQNITMASNGAEAVDNVKESIAKNETFDLIFMDVQMPKIDGLLATRMIRTNLNYDKPIIALTAFADESNARECLNNGMSGFLAKPIRRTNLRKIITEFSPILLREVVTTPQTHQSDEKRLGYDTPKNQSSSHVNDSS